ncbi:MAG TPA: hypothetical protein VMU75_11170 [Acidimicrobiales bacterium]|nr:hypothetical protein [Acidimicrobiales bacterium]
MIDVEGLASVRTALEADGYEIAVEDGERIGVVISATPDACAECLVPASVMVPILEHALKVPADRIDLTYPEGHDGE